MTAICLSVKLVVLDIRYLHALHALNGCHNISYSLKHARLLAQENHKYLVA